MTATMKHSDVSMKVSPDDGRDNPGASLLTSINYTIRTATIADAPVIAHHRASMFRDMGVIDNAMAASLEAASESYLLKAMASEEYLAWLAESGDKIIAGGGMIIRQLLPRPWHIKGGFEAHILNMYTEPSHRRRGLARKIMSAMLDWCHLQGINRITLHASDEGRPLYQAFGFIQTNEMRFEIVS